ncbi:MAG: glycosyltransferase family 4 protein [Gammaproteobacteria bacterium]|nr:glycosyltransferase family 4 protein [Gammaproteobacteria bacterium]
MNESIAVELAKRYKIPRPLVIMNTPSLSMIDINEDFRNINTLRKSLNINNNEPIILYQGGFSSNRGLENLVHAMTYIDKGILVFLGWGPLEAHLRRLSEKLNLTNRVFFHPPVPQAELLHYTKGATVGVIPYRATSLNNYYSTPNKLFEYLMAGIPVVASDFPELRRIIKKYHIGLTFDPEDPKSIADAINTLLTNSRLYRQMKNNINEAIVHFNWEREAQKLLDLYKNILNCK